MQLELSQSLHPTISISPLQHGSFLYGHNAYFNEQGDRAIITWQYDNPASLDVQAVLFSNGRIRLNYAAVSGILHGAGHHQVTWNGRDDQARLVPSGTYFYSLQVGEFQQIRRLALVR